MLLVIPFCEKDRLAAIRLLEWIGQLGKDNWHHTCLIVAASTVEQSELYGMINTAKGIFGGVLGLKQVHSDERGWPMSCNAMFRTTIDYIEREACTPFFWCEPDCVPLVPDWLTKIEQAYQKGGKPFMGVIYDQPWPHLTGCAVYPPDYRKINPEALKADKQPWDVVAPDTVMPLTHSTSLIQHVWGKGKEPPTFNGDDSLSIISKDAVLFHRCKDDTLITALRRRFKIGIPRLTERRLVVRRTLARGDVIAASFVSTRLQELGYQVTFQTDKRCADWLKYIVPAVDIATVDRACHINLDEAYESHPRQKELSFAEMFLERASAWAAKNKIDLGRCRNYAPRMVLPEVERQKWIKRFKNYPRPWIMFCPRSQSHIRIVPDNIWRDAATDMPGTKFWLAVHGAAPYGIVDVRTNLAETPASIAAMDLFVTSDTGPMHVAAALGVPTIVVEQSFNPELRLSDQRDWLKVRPNLSCLNCQGPLCRLNNSDPPCKHIPPSLLSNAVNRRLSVTTDDVSAVVAIYRPTAGRLNRCLAAALPQVKEIVVAVDKAGVLPEGALQDPRIWYVTSRQKDIGYGRKANFGARHTVSPWILFLNDDCYMEPDCVEKLRAAVTDKVAVVGALLTYPNGTIQHGGTTRTPGQRDWAHLDHGLKEPTIKEPTEMEFVTGACTLIKRKAFYEISGFDEEFYLYCDDSDFCMRVRQAGYKVMYTPFAKAIHECGASSGMTSNLSACVQESGTRLRKKWAWYFEKNFHNRLGVFK